MPTVVVVETKPYEVELIGPFASETTAIEWAERALDPLALDWTVQPIRLPMITEGVV